MSQRTIKFRGKRTDNGEWVYGFWGTRPDGANFICPFENYESYGVLPETVGQWTGLLDKNKVEIFEGDILMWRNPVRTTQTHTGDNIPNGSYTEPMEPGIITHEEEVEFRDGCFGYSERTDSFVPLTWVGMYWDLESIKEAISYGKPGRFIWDDPEEGDLQYLMEECAKVKTTEELVEYLSGVEVITSIHTH